MLNPFLMQVLGVLVRSLLMSLIGAVGLTHVLQPVIDANLTQFNQLVAAIAAGLVVLAYQAWKAFRGRQKLLQALGAASLTEHEVEQMVASKIVATPSVTTAKHEVP